MPVSKSMVPPTIELGRRRSETEEETQDAHAGAGVLRQENDIVLIKTHEAWQQLLSGEQPMLVMFTSKWCGICQMMKGPFSNMKDYAPKSCLLAVVDLEQSDKAICSSALGQIAFVPAFQIYIDGDRADYFIANHEDTLKEKIDKVKADVEQRERAAKRRLGCFSAFRWPCRVCSSRG